MACIYVYIGEARGFHPGTSTIDANLRISIFFPRYIIDVNHRISIFFPRFFELEDNQHLMTEIGKEKQLKTLHIFQKDKISVPDRLPVDFFLKCFDYIEADLHRVVEETQLFGKILSTFNTTFIMYIPKMENPTTFENFHPISLYNSIYNIITNINSCRIKEIIFKMISL